MKDRRDIVEIWGRGSAAALVTLVRVEGSSYRRQGARLLVGRGGIEHAGTISGGCLESEVIRRAIWVSRDRAVVERYATTFDDTSDIPFGLGCGGTVDLLFESVTAPEGAALLGAIAASLEGRGSTVVSFLPDARRGLQRVIFDALEDITFATKGLGLHEIARARGLIAGTEYEDCFVERLEPPQRLFVLGAGEDARPLVEMGAMLGWTVTVADGRAQFATAKRFPRAESVSVLRASGSLQSLGIGPADAVILMTHSYEQDRELLTGVLPLAPRYLGLLGSRHRSSLLVAEAAAMLGCTVESCCQSIFAPVGMDLGGDGPEAIALAIVAEVQAVANGRLGSLSARRLAASEVALEIQRGGPSKYLQTSCALELEPDLG